MKKIKDFYDKRFLENKKNNPLIHKKEYRRGLLFKKLIGTNKKILVLGPDRGQILNIFKKNNEIICGDISENVKMHLEKKGIDCLLFNIEEKFPFENETFDIVVAGELIEHLFDPENLVNESWRVLKKKGAFIGSTPNAFNWRVRIATLLNIQKLKWNNEHIRFFNDKVLKELLKKYFKKVLLTNTSRINFLQSIFVYNFVWKCIK